jgi:uncharacterized protein
VTEQDATGESADVSWQLDSTTIDGTLVRPLGPGPFPAVVLVAGSGPTDRDWHSPLLPGSTGRRQERLAIDTVSLTALV